MSWYKIVDKSYCFWKTSFDLDKPIYFYLHIIYKRKGNKHLCLHNTQMYNDLNQYSHLSYRFDKKLNVKKVAEDRHKWYIAEKNIVTFRFLFGSSELFIWSELKSVFFISSVECTKIEKQIDASVVGKISYVYGIYIMLFDLKTIF